MVASAATLQQHGIWFVMAAVAYFAYRLVSNAQNLSACHQVIFFAIACNITSCIFIARSIAALG